MLARSALASILDDESLTRHLGDAESRLLVEWLVDRAEELGQLLTEVALATRLQTLCRRGRLIARFVRLWALDHDPRGAIQLAASERLEWPLPDGPRDPWTLMHQVLAWEMRRLSG
jgi:hypothetical protein